MTTITLELSSDIYRQLSDKSYQQGHTIEKMIQEWIIEHITLPPPKDSREQAHQLLKMAGLHTELSPELQKRAKNSTATLAQVQAAFARAGGQPLSEMVIEMRGPKL
jgi:tRNA A37 threonylcarbamoyltransferase TsaD